MGNDYFGDAAVLIPWRAGDPQRERVFHHLYEQWLKLAQDTDLQVIVGQPTDMEGPFNCASALNNAFNQITDNRDKIVMFGADCVPDEEAILHALLKLDHGYKWVEIFSETQYYDRETTDKILAGHEHQWFDTDPSQTVPFCTGVLALTKEAYVTAGGFDERFVGWGAEDAAFRHVLWQLFQDTPQSSFTLKCLWHETSNRGKMSANNRSLIDHYISLDTTRKVLDYLKERDNYAL